LAFSAAARMAVPAAERRKKMPRAVSARTDATTATMWSCVNTAWSTIRWKCHGKCGCVDGISARSSCFNVPLKRLTPKRHCGKANTSDTSNCPTAIVATVATRRGDVANLRRTRISIAAPTAAAPSTDSGAANHHDQCSATRLVKTTDALNAIAAWAKVISLLARCTRSSPAANNAATSPSIAALAITGAGMTELPTTAVRPTPMSDATRTIPSASTGAGSVRRDLIAVTAAPPSDVAPVPRTTP
jgi:hypothetical protein